MKAWLPGIASRLRSRGSRVVAGSVLAAAALTLFLNSPRIWVWAGLTVPDEMLAKEPEIHRAQYLLTQFDRPWDAIPGLERTSDFVIQWRLFLPVAGHYLGLSHAQYLALPFAGCIAALGLIAGLLWKRLGRPWLVFGGTLIAANCSWFFVSTGWLGYEDSWLVFALVAASFARSRLALAAIALAAPWVDERFILSFPLVLGVRLLDGEAAGDRKALLRDGAALVLGIAPYLLVRAGAEWLGARATTHAYWNSMASRKATGMQLLMGGWHGLRAGWGCVAALAWFGAARAGGVRRFAMAAAGIIAAVLVNLLLVEDLSRSISVLLPAVVAGIIAGAAARPRAAGWGIAVLCAASLALPARHVLSVFEVPIEWLPTELAHWRAMPDFRSAEYRIGQGYASLQRSDPENALEWFESALAAAPESWEARANRGVLLCSFAGNPEEGFSELGRALRQDPAALDRIIGGNPDLLDARLVRANLRMRAGDVAGARDDLRHLLRKAPMGSTLWDQAEAALAEVESIAR